MKLLCMGFAAMSVGAAIMACDDDNCSLVGCGTVLEISLEVDDGGPLPDATDEIVLELDGAAYVTVCGRPAGAEITCEPVEGPDEIQLVPIPAEDGTSITFVVVPEDDKADLPASIHFSVLAGDATLVDTTVEPTYTVTFPNGEGCGPKCQEAAPIVGTFSRE